MFNKVERIISYRNLKPKKKEGFLKVISVFSFLGILLGVAILIIVMSVMNGFRTDLTDKILGLNPHLVIEPSGNKINQSYFENLKLKYENFKLNQSQIFFIILSSFILLLILPAEPAREGGGIIFRLLSLINHVPSKYVFFYWGNFCFFKKSCLAFFCNFFDLFY